MGGALISLQRITAVCSLRDIKITFILSYKPIEKNSIYWLDSRSISLRDLGFHFIKITLRSTLILVSYNLINESLGNHIYKIRILDIVIARNSLLLVWKHYLLKIVFFSSFFLFFFLFFFFFFGLHAFGQQIGWLILSSACLNFVPEYSDSFRYRPGNARKSSAFFQWHRCISADINSCYCIPMQNKKSTI